MNMMFFSSPQVPDCDDTCESSLSSYRQRTQMWYTSTCDDDINDVRYNKLHVKL